MRIRATSLRDYEAMCALFDEPDELHRRARPEMFQPFARPARAREQASAFAGAVPRKVIELDNLAVRAGQRGRKIGRRLLAASLDWVRDRKATHLEVAVHAFNKNARRFYEGFGFVPSTDRLMLVA